MKSMSPAFVIDYGLEPRGYVHMVAVSAVAAVALTTLVIGFGWWTNGHYETLLSSIGIIAVAVVGYQVFVGNTGIVSFGHPAFAALGAYTTGILAIPTEMKSALLPNLPAWLSVISVGPAAATIAGGIVALLFALAVGSAVMRLSGAAAGIMTFGLLVITNEVLRNATNITKGNQTFFGVPRSVDSTSIYMVLALVIVFAIAFKYSNLGLRARAVREDPLAAEMSGISIVGARLWAWGASAFVTGIAGGLLAQNLTSFSPNSFYMNLVVPILLMSVLGGMNSVLGAVAGTALISLWQQFMRLAEGSELPLVGFKIPIGISDLTLGLALVLILLIRPGGVAGDFELGPRPKRSEA